MMRISIACLWRFVVAVVALFARAPATWVDRRVAAATEGRMRINDAQGTVWRGHGALGDSRGSWRIPVVWHIAPLALARGALDIEFEASPASGGPRGRIILGDGSATLHANIAAGPDVPADIARTIAALGTPDANGVVHVQWHFGK